MKFSTLVCAAAVAATASWQPASGRVLREREPHVGERRLAPKPEVPKTKICGSLITEDTTLEENLICPECPALVVDGNLRLGGKTVSCTGTTVIEVIGQGNSVQGPGTGK